MSTLGERMKEALEESGKRLVDLATACGVKPPSAHAWLSGETKILKAKSAMRAASFLGVNQLWLTEGIGPKRPEEKADPSESKLLSDWRALPVGWRYYIQHKTAQLHAIAEGLPTFLKESLKTIPPESAYWQWERELEDYLKRESHIIEDDGYLGPERRLIPEPIAEERRAKYRLPAPRPTDNGAGARGKAPNKRKRRPE